MKEFYRYKFFAGSIGKFDFETFLALKDMDNKKMNSKIT
jgi:hypothetical protein